MSGTASEAHAVVTGIVHVCGHVLWPDTHWQGSESGGMPHLVQAQFTTTLHCITHFDTLQIFHVTRRPSSSASFPLCYLSHSHTPSFLLQHLAVHPSVPKARALLSLSHCKPFPHPCSSLFLIGHLLLFRAGKRCALPPITLPPLSSSTVLYVYVLYLHRQSSQCISWALAGDHDERDCVTTSISSDNPLGIDVVGLAFQ